ncbi:hypothetical protein ACFPM0_24895 [Pseudonocardia sulfidoxydans]|uniref:hypothetical protein n=1 Tax=Pseudonocardia sulfidoxydans TaxID=54011 RepID=UPI0036245D4D
MEGLVHPCGDAAAAGAGLQHVVGVAGPLTWPWPPSDVRGAGGAERMGLVRRRGRGSGRRAVRASRRGSGRWRIGALSCRLGGRRGAPRPRDAPDASLWTRARNA